MIAVFPVICRFYYFFLSDICTYIQFTYQQSLADRESLES
jgi:hypothetical protein